MSLPDTRDPDMVKMPRDQFEFMRDTTNSLATINANLSHLKDQVTELKTDLNNQKTVVSGITSDRDNFVGGKTVLGWVSLGFISIIGWVVSWFHK